MFVFTMGVYGMVLIFLGISCGALIHAIKRKKDVPLHSAILLFVINLTSLIAFAIGRVVGGVELTAACYDISLFIFLVVTD